MKVKVWSVMPVSEKERELVRFIMGNASNRNRDLATHRTAPRTDGEEVCISKNKNALTAWFQWGKKVAACLQFVCITRCFQ